MGLVLTFTGAWVLAIVLWAVGVMKFFDAFVIGMTILLLVATAKLVAPYLPGRKD